MSNSRTVRRPSRRTNTTAGRVLSAGLATATCVGLVGVIGVRVADENAAKAAQASDAQAAADQAAIQSGSVQLTAATSSDGLTREQLDAYAAQLNTERQRLADYRNQLIAVAGQLQEAANANPNVRVASVKKPAAVKKTSAKKSSATKSTAQPPTTAQQAQPAQAPAAAPQAQPAQASAPKAQPAPAAAPQPAAKPRPQAQTQGS